MDPTGDGSFRAVPPDNSDDGAFLAMRLSGGGIIEVRSDGTIKLDTNGDFDDLGEGELQTATFAYKAINGWGDIDTARVSVVIEGGTCPLACTGGGECRAGPADYGRVGTFPFDSPIEFVTAWEEGGDSCMCPDGLVGHGCDHPYELCDPDGPADDVDSSFACFHGGQCVWLGGEGDGGGAERWGCDCSGASWGDNVGGSRPLGVAGRHCEYRFTDACSPNGLEFYCANGGTCDVGENG